MAKATKIREETLAQLAQDGINENDLYSIVDYPMGGITNSEMVAALTQAQDGFYRVNSVYLCVDSGTYLQNHFYKFNRYSWVDVTPEFAGEIKIKTLAEMESEVIDEDTLYNIVDYPIGGITQAQMNDALTVEQLGFYQVGSVYLCTDSGNDYVQNHFYKFSYDDVENEYYWYDTHAGADVDDALSTTSTNPVENRLVTNALNDKVSLTKSESIGGQKVFTNIPKYGQARLPSEYQEVEYIQSSGSQYIDTGFKPSDSPYFKIEMELTFLNLDNKYVYSAGGNPWLSFEKNSQGFYWNAGSTTVFGVHSLSANIKYNYEITYNNGTFTSSGAYNGTHSYSGNLGSTNFTFFGSTSSMTSCKLYKLKLYSGQNYTLVRDLVPCYTKQGVTNNGTTYPVNTIGLYDLVNNIFYANLGSGIFTKGNDLTLGDNFALITDVNTKVGLTGNETIQGVKTFDQRPILGNVRLPSQFTEVEYIEFTGTQYINTNLIPSNHKTEIKYDIQTYVNDAHILGTDASSSYYHFTTYSNSYYWGLNGSENHAGTFTTGIHTLYYNTGENHQVILDTTILGSGSNISASQNLLIGRRSSTTNLKAKIYYCKVTNLSDNTLVRNLVPCYTNQSVTNNGTTYPENTIGLYDIVNNIFYVNAGSGVFIKGNNVLIGDRFATLTDVNNKVSLTGNETIAGTKTFSTRPLVGTTTPEGVALQSEIPEIEANNQETTTATLTKLSIDGVNYAIESGMSNPMTTSGDIIVGSTNGTPTRIAKGTTGQVLGIDNNGDVAYINQSASTGVTSIGGATGTITLGSGLSINNNELSAIGGGGGITNYEVIDKVNSLPTATATSADIIQIDGELYFKNVTIWDEPEQSGEDLQINQVYSATQSGSNLEIS